MSVTHVFDRNLRDYPDYHLLTKWFRVAFGYPENEIPGALPVPATYIVDQVWLQCVLSELVPYIRALFSLNLD